MIPRGRSWILFLVVVVGLFLTNAGQAQQAIKPGEVPKPGQNPTQPSSSQTPSGQSPAERRPPAPEYAIAFIATVLVLVIVCMPSRKRQN
jgi:hypothetical protein